MIYERARCVGCGTFPDEWIPADPDDNEPFVIPPPFEAEERICGGCQERERFEAQAYEKKRPPGAHVVLAPADPAEYVPAMFTGPSKLEVAMAED